MKKELPIVTYRSSADHYARSYDQSARVCVSPLYYDNLDIALDTITAVHHQQAHMYRFFCADTALEILSLNV